MIIRIKISVLGPRGGIQKKEVDAITTSHEGLVITKADGCDDDGYRITHQRSGHAVTEITDDVFGLFRMADEIAGVLDWSLPANQLVNGDRARYDRAAKRIRKAAAKVKWTARSSSAANAKSREVFGLET